MTVVTYQYAYIQGDVSLCSEHAEKPPEWLPILGPVNHGAHEGICDAC